MFYAADKNCQLRATEGWNSDGQVAKLFTMKKKKQKKTMTSTKLGTELCVISKPFANFLLKQGINSCNQFSCLELEKKC